jgi:hypothetical protein
MSPRDDSSDLSDDGRSVLLSPLSLSNSCFNEGIAHYIERDYIFNVFTSALFSLACLFGRVPFAFFLSPDELWIIDGWVQLLIFRCRYWEEINFEMVDDCSEDVVFFYCYRLHLPCRRENTSLIASSYFLACIVYFGHERMLNVER